MFVKAKVLLDHSLDISKYLDTSCSRQHSKKNPKMSWYSVSNDWLHILSLIFGHGAFLSWGI